MQTALTSLPELSLGLNPSTDPSPTMPGADEASSTCTDAVPMPRPTIGIKRPAPGSGTPYEDLSNLASAFPTFAASETVPASTNEMLQANDVPPVPATGFNDPHLASLSSEAQAIPAFIAPNQSELAGTPTTTQPLHPGTISLSISTGVNMTTAPSAKRPRPSREGVRRGKWTSEEQAYADRLIRDFEAGILPLENGATLRAFLSKKLNCDPMRISKKFAGARCLGKQIFLKRTTEALDDTTKRDDESLKQLEENFLRSISNVSSNTSTRRRNRTSTATTEGKSTKSSNKTATDAGVDDKSKKSSLLGSSLVKLSSSDEGETDEEMDSDVPNLPRSMHKQAQPQVERTMSSSDEDLSSSSDESSLDDHQHHRGRHESSLLVIEDIKEAMNALSSEMVDLPSGLSSSYFMPGISSTQLAGSSQHISAMDEDLTFLATDIIEPLGEFLPDECFTEYVAA